MNSLLVIISGPSGSGKGETIKRMLNRRKDFERISTYTTRKPREGEKSGEQYNFISPEEYLKLLDGGKLMACSRIEDTYYGAPIIDESVDKGEETVLLIDIGVSGGLEIKRKYPEAVMIYLIPETEEQLLRQRGNRGKTRHARGIKQIQELLTSDQYEWLVRNGNIEKTVDIVELIIDFVHKMRCEGLTDGESKRYDWMREQMAIHSPHNIKFLEEFYKIREKGDNER